MKNTETKENKAKSLGGEASMALCWSEGWTYLADTLVVKETHSLTNVNGVVPVMSSHCAGVVPPEITGLLKKSGNTSDSG